MTDPDRVFYLAITLIFLTMSRITWLMTDILVSIRRFVKEREGARDKENRAKKRKVRDTLFAV